MCAFFSTPSFSFSYTDFPVCKTVSNAMNVHCTLMWFIFTFQLFTHQLWLLLIQSKNYSNSLVYHINRFKRKKKKWIYIKWRRQQQQRHTAIALKFNETISWYVLICCALQTVHIFSLFSLAFSFVTFGIFVICFFLFTIDHSACLLISRKRAKTNNTKSQHHNRYL